MQMNEKLAAVEAILFASGEPIERDTIAMAAEVEPELVPRLIELLCDRYEETHSALQILRLEQSYQLCTRPAHLETIRRAMETKRSTPLSNAAMETLTIIAYNQPVTKSFVEHVRGIDSSSVVNTLVEKDLLAEAGRLEVPGRPIAYCTTSRFLRCFGLHSLDELPPLPNQNESATLFDLNVDDALAYAAEHPTSPEGDELI